ncbi:right-handed parallel beta-helix repeat-containing protein [Myxococcota bacterium]|nr:right-handed parallel beta-helix repeat-containing protein [Myxococcota bacterium]
MKRSRSTMTTAWVDPLRMALVFLSLGVAEAVFASDGVLEINQTCAVQTGCFPGDPAGMPVQITSTGSYRLTSNLTPPNQDTNVISISAAGVSVDLNGFAIQGGNTTFPCSSPGSGVGVTSSASATSVSNGSIQGMGTVGVQLVASTVARVERVIAELNCGTGIVVGNGSLVTNSVARNNSGQGISVLPTSRVSDSVANSNSGNGIFGPTGYVSVDGCVTNGNGFWGIRIESAASLVTDSMATGNGQSGIYLHTGSLVLRSSTNSNGTLGIESATGTSAIGFITSNGNSVAAVGGTVARVGCSALGGVGSCP